MGFPVRKPTDLQQTPSPCPPHIVVDSLPLFAFLSLLTGFIEAVYALGLLRTNIPPQIIFVVFLLSPVLLLPVPRLLDSRAFTLTTGSAGLTCWAISLPLDTRWRMLVTGLGSGLLLLFLTARIRQVRRSPLESGGALAFAVLLSVVLRALHSGNLLLVDVPSLPLGIALAVFGVGLLLFAGRRTPSLADGQGTRGSGQAGFGRTFGLSLGLFGVLVLLYFGFTSPAVIARWGEAGYPAVTAVETGGIALFLGLWIGLPRMPVRLVPGPLLVWNLLFLLALAVALFFRRPAFAADATYPLDAPNPCRLASIALWAMLVLHPVMYANFALFAGALHTAQPSPRQLAGGFVIGALYLMVMVFAQIFTTVYDYIPIVGPWFRDQFWLVVSLPGLVVTLAALFLNRESVADLTPTRVHPTWLLATGILVPGVLAGAAIVLSILGGACPVPGPHRTSLRILTYNLQQGIGESGERSYDQQLKVIRQLDPDVIGLQETDTARIAGGNADLVRHYADRLNLHSYYGPSPVSGTFGIALLSRYPLQNPRTFFLRSEGEQTAAIEARIEVGGRLFHVLVTHLDNGGALVQQIAVLDQAAHSVSGQETDIVMGDFNFTTSTSQYRATTTVLEDAWLVAAERTVEPGAPDPANRIDHIFVSAGTRVLRSVYTLEGPSDHPGIFAEIAW